MWRSSCCVAFSRLGTCSERLCAEDSGAARQAVASGAIPQVLAALNLSMGREIQCHGYHGSRKPLITRYGGLLALRHMMDASRQSRYFWQERLALQVI